MVIYYIVLLIMTMFGSVASLFLKKASGSNDLIDMLKNINLYIGGFLYVSSAVLNIWLLKILDYSVILPLTSLTVKKIAGVCLILVGAIIISSL